MLETGQISMLLVLRMSFVMEESVFFSVYSAIG